jgi:hypothetical protein
LYIPFSGSLLSSSKQASESFVLLFCIIWTMARNVLLPYVCDSLVEACVMNFDLKCKHFFSVQEWLQVTIVTLFYEHRYEYIGIHVRLCVICDWQSGIVKYFFSKHNIFSLPIISPHNPCSPVTSPRYALYPSKSWLCVDVVYLIWCFARLNVSFISAEGFVYLLFLRCSKTWGSLLTMKRCSFRRRLQKIS